jgi:hypothetical protein
MSGFLQNSRLALGPGLLLALLVPLCWPRPALPEGFTEYQVKAVYLYNFTTYTEWPAEVGGILNLCTFGRDSFGEQLDKMGGKTAGERVIAVRRAKKLEQLDDCQVIFITRSKRDELPQLLARIKGTPVLTVTDTPGALQQGVVLNMEREQNKVTFKANLAAAKSNRLSLSSKLLRLAREVIR